MPIKFKTVKGKEIYLSFRDTGDYIAIVACDKENVLYPYGYLLRIHKETGRRYRYRHINRDLGLSLDDEGRLKFAITDKEM